MQMGALLQEYRVLLGANGVHLKWVHVLLLLASSDSSGSGDEDSVLGF